MTRRRDHHDDENDDDNELDGIDRLKREILLFTNDAKELERRFRGHFGHFNYSLCLSLRKPNISVAKISFGINSVAD